MSLNTTLCNFWITELYCRNLIREKIDNDQLYFFKLFFVTKYPRGNDNAEDMFFINSFTTPISNPKI
ncbi:hypothetical protein BpHYR1_029385 [Brachionus plicatilis]|uniref:Uncharacterized protein n=1 Tax=Brachionus plicatilis TaxID=10195 RepID=A0A3M7PBF5_BRAPC|nr:hypothetical protein BpHYR1_029385 [Brachionus plicatilis]